MGSGPSSIKSLYDLTLIVLVLASNDKEFRSWAMIWRLEMTDETLYKRLMRIANL